ncbi:DUF4236 domain-containing protein [Streptomyces albus]|uniref:DUF4236 domain-containing protein n=1 Tax=Streptomyces albus TaxID=1888 RepID=UPI0024ACDEFE|nr:DUF4236 domain-containing protein [Streptomyces albus]MDI6411210.1 DUF4236 domain-containing protein [Streptomyces albus]
MAPTFRKSVRILPGVRLDLSRRSWSVTLGGRRHSLGTRGRRTSSADLPGPLGRRRSTTTRNRRRTRSGR